MTPLVFPRPLCTSDWTERRLIGRNTPGGGAVDHDAAVFLNEHLQTGRSGKADTKDFYDAVESNAHAAAQQVTTAKQNILSRSLRYAGSWLGMGKLGMRSSTEVATRGALEEQGTRLLKNTETIMNDSENKALQRIKTITGNSHAKLLLLTANVTQSADTIAQLRHRKEQLILERDDAQTGLERRKEIIQMLRKMVEREDFAETYQNEMLQLQKEQTDNKHMEALQESEREIARWLSKKDLSLIPHIPALLKANMEGDGAPLEKAIKKMKTKNSAEESERLSILEKAKKLCPREYSWWAPKEDNQRGALAAAYQKYSLVKQGEINPATPEDRARKIENLSYRHTIRIFIRGEWFNFIKAVGLEKDHMFILKSDKAPDCVVNTKTATLTIPGKSELQPPVTLTLQAPPVYDADHKPLKGYDAATTLYLTAA